VEEPLDKAVFCLYSLIWSVCASVDENGRKKLDNILREMEGIFPDKDTIYEYFVDVGSKSLISWEVKLSDQWKHDKE
jgi:dynein heavy chain